ncbi:hypothetical protein FB451DRAFT_1167304 [Mycena latifolia]|nr:hypothetical protein FB451DRAFT_1167304 [Mycena latifolia]
MPFTNTNRASPSTSSRPSVDRSTTMPAFRRPLSIPSVQKPLASLRASTNKGLRRMSTLRAPKASTASSASTIRPSTSMESIPVFTIPDYTQPAASCPPSVDNISPLTMPTPSFNRAMTMPSPVRALRSTTLAKFSALGAVCGSPRRRSSTVSVESPQRKSSVASVETVSTVSTTSTRRRSSSVSSVESFNSNEDRITLELPKRKLALRPYEREIVITVEHERNPPTLRRATRTSRFSRCIAKVYRRTLRRVARARRTSGPSEALAVLFTPKLKRVCAATPVHIDPQTLVSEVPLVVYSSPIALPLPKGPASTVQPARKARKSPLSRTMNEDEIMDEALCAGW